MKTVQFKGRSRIFRLMLVFLVMGGLASLNSRAEAQEYKAVGGSSIKVNGTSNLHNWIMQAGSFSAEAQLSLKGDKVSDITSLTFSLPVQNLKAKEDLMNTRAYKAMKADKYPTITFKLTGADVNQSAVKATGTLTIAGVSKAVQLQGKVVENSDGTVTITGSRGIKMSEYGITPPTFMLGALKVGDEVTVEFALKLKK